MKVKNISYPYPVLGNEDDVDGRFVPSFRHILGNEKIILKVKFELKNKTLEELIEQKKAMFSIELECNSTFYRASLGTFNYEGNLEIEAAKCRDRVVVKFFIRACQPLSDYSISNCNKDYTDLIFDLNKGDILAVGGQSSFIAEKGFDPLRPIVSAFIAVREGHEDEGPMVVDFGDLNRILIKLAKKDWSRYQGVKGSPWTFPIIHASIVFPVLADAIRRIHEEDEDIESTRWCGRLKTILEQKGLPLDDPFYSAQVILQSPLTRSLITIESQGLGDEGDL